jgi:hypothetical protein
MLFHLWCRVLMRRIAKAAVDIPIEAFSATWGEDVLYTWDRDRVALTRSIYHEEWRVYNASTMTRCTTLGPEVGDILFHVQW